MVIQESSQKAKKRKIRYLKYTSQTSQDREGSSSQTCAKSCSRKKFDGNGINKRSFSQKNPKITPIHLDSYKPKLVEGYSSFIKGSRPFQ